MRLLVIVGPTACGKTRLAVRVARALGSEIVSADSRQVYRGLDIGSGKDLDEYSSVDPPVPVRLIDVADPARPYSVFRYQHDCYRVFEAWQSQGRETPLVLAGGTGLYVEAVLRAYRIADVPENEDLRARLMRRDRVELERELQRLDPERARATDTSSKKRIVRALEIADVASRGPVRYSDDPPVALDTSVFGVEIPRDELARRIDRRLDERMRQGMVAEVERLLASGVTPQRLTQLGLEYREIGAYLVGDKTLDRALEDLRTGIQRFAKRQRTWFRGLERRGIAVTWIGPDDVDVVLARV
ncbi:MAG: tRNA (adenosine(37)-N6)-dimethylallyltransferase MiaA [bacterium]|nr:tRNA (adenosine(37)-N6)-dimethylallyltransferase MiaA [bacterium]